jgi:hypothetical protein
MTKPASMASLFAEPPRQFGMRGDVHLWADMTHRFENVPCPDTHAEAAALIEQAFLHLTGRPISEEKPFLVEKYNHGGMSGGFVHPEWWRTKLLPLLLSRLPGSETMRDP